MTPRPSKAAASCEQVDGTHGLSALRPGVRTLAWLRTRFLGMFGRLLVEAAPALRFSFSFPPAFARRCIVVAAADGAGSGAGAAAATDPDPASFDVLPAAGSRSSAAALLSFSFTFDDGAGDGAAAGVARGVAEGVECCEEAIASAWAWAAAFFSA